MSKLDLTENCALCGGQLQYADRYNPRLAEPRREYIDDDLDDAVSYCSCEGRGKPGKCGTCDACRTEDHGCGCDGACDNGCFFCNPNEYERPACPLVTFKALVQYKVIY